MEKINIPQLSKIMQNVVLNYSHKKIKNVDNANANEIRFDEAMKNSKSIFPLSGLLHSIF